MNKPLQARRLSILLMLTIVHSGPTFAEALPRIAVTDLAYEDQVSRYFSTYSSRETVDSRAASNQRYRDSDFGSSGSASNRESYRSDRSVSAASGYVTTIDRGELRKFTADVKGELLKSGSYRLTQGKPWTQTNTEKLFDIVDRIKRGYFPGADYVLFGSINNIAFRNEVNPIQGSNATNHSLTLELVAEFTLINTRTYEVKAAFSAAGDGTDARLVNLPGQTFSLSRGKVMQDVSRTLGQAVATEMESQFAPMPNDRTTSFERSREVRSESHREERATVYR